MSSGNNRSFAYNNRIRKALLVLLLCCCLPVFSVAKAILYEGRDGLSSNDISAIAKDSRGLMWIGTLNGLNIYDGYTFTKVPGPVASLPIISLAINNSRNELLAGTTKGLFSINLSTLQATRLEKERPGGVPWNYQHVPAICIHPVTHEIFVSFEHGYLARVNKNARLELVTRLTDTVNYISNIAASPDNKLIVTNGSLYTVDPRSGVSSLIPAFKNIAPVTIAASGNTLLINGFFSKFSMADMRTFSDITPEIMKQRQKAFPYRIQQTQLHNNKLYVLSDNYTFIIADLAKGTINEVSKKYPDIFEGKIYNSLFVDEHDIIWIATNKGLIKIEERPELFQKSLSNLPNRVSTRKMIEDADGDIYVSSYVGLWHLSKQSQTWTNYRMNSADMVTSDPSAYDKPVQPLALLAIPNSNYLYLGFDSEKLLRFDKKKKTFEKLNYPIENGNDDIEGIYSLVEDRNGTIWIGCGNGLASYDPKWNRLTVHHNDPYDVGKSRVRYILESKERDKLFVSSLSGLYIIDIDGGVKRHFDQSSHPALTHNDVLYIGQDKGGRLWLGTNGGGINILSADMKSIQTIHKQDGLSSEVVYSIIPQDENTYWIATFNGLDRYRKSQRSFSNFFEEDGLSSNEFNQNSFLKTRNGEMYFGSINGITSFYPQRFDLSVPFKIYLSGISKWDDKTQMVQLLRDQVSSGDKLTKKPSDLLFELHFACTDYADPLRNTYSYRIKELSDNWISLEDRHTLNLGGIPYGNYVLEVKAINSRGASSENILVYNIVVVQPFYKTWWFFALILTGIALIFYAAYLIKYQSFKDILHLRMKIASNLHDEVGSLLTRITMFSDNLRYGKNTEEQRNVKLEKIAILSRNAIASMSDVLWAIDSRNDFAGNLLDRMREHTEEMLVPLGIDVNFVLSGTDLKLPISSDIRGEIYLIFKEAINNIVKHSEATHVDILYQMNDKRFLLRITNNGARGQISEISTGQGLSNMKMRAKKTGAAIHVEQEGETFTIEIKN